MTASELRDFLRDERIAVTDTIETALQIAEKVHGQTRRESDGSGYLEQHIIPVVANYVEWVKHHAPSDTNIHGRPALYLPVTPIHVAALLLHDDPEDEKGTMRDDIPAWQKHFADRFGADGLQIYGIIRPMTRPKWQSFSGGNELEQRIAADNFMISQLSQGWNDPHVQTQLPVAVAGKMADRYNNITCTPLPCRPDKTAYLLYTTLCEFVPWVAQQSKHFLRHYVDVLEDKIDALPDIGPGVKTPELGQLLEKQRALYPVSKVA